MPIELSAELVEPPGDRIVMRVRVDWELNATEVTAIVAAAMGTGLLQGAPTSKAEVGRALREYLREYGDGADDYSAGADAWMAAERAVQRLFPEWWRPLRP